jgi:predicted XRE-type DNA-binding protein
VKITKSCGNVFADIGFPPDEAANLIARASLMARLTKIAQDRELTPHAAAKLFGITQPRVRLLFNRKIGEFSVDDLVNLLGRAGFETHPENVSALCPKKIIATS